MRWTQRGLDAKNGLRAFVGAHRHAKALRASAWAGNTLARWVDNQNDDLKTNGERRLVQLLGADHLHTVLDVGANIGLWALEVLTVAPLAGLHCFEPLTATADRFERRLLPRYPDATNIHLERIALGDEPGELELFSEIDADAKAGVHERPGARSETCRVERGDRYCADRGIGHIDLLKVDVEGFELSVLSGFGDRLTDGSIDVIQFEMGEMATASRVALLDFYRLLTDYEVGRLFPDGVEFCAYHPRDEWRSGPNHVAVRRSRTDLLDLLRV